MSNLPMSESKPLMQICRSLFVTTAILAAALSLQAQDDKKKQDKVVKAEAEQLKKQAKREKRYMKIRDFAKDKWTKDPDFRELVNDRYRETRQSHMRYAYSVNMMPSNIKLVERDGEKMAFNWSLYANPLAQDYVNRVGQSLVPANSTRLYSFKIVQNPVPESKSLSSGTVYITTGLLSIIDNEAQLAYILGHEISHIERDHWFDDVLVAEGTDLYQKEKEAGKMFLKNIVGALNGSSIKAAIAAAAVTKAFDLDEAFQWESVQEDEADNDAMKYMFARNYDVREIPKFYARMSDLTRDPRSQTGFIADPTRVGERMDEYTRSSASYTKTGTNVGAIDLSAGREKNLRVTGSRGIARMLNEVLAPEIQKKLENNELMASSEEFQSTMALVKRDNGIRALQFDMFTLARNNLEDSLAIRSNDPVAYYYFGKAVKQTARNAAEVSTALNNLNMAINTDKRQTIAEPYLYRAMLRLGGRNPNEAAMIANDLRKYVEIFQRENKGELPPNMEFVYDFMQDLEVLDYRATPAANTADAPRMVVGSQPPSSGAAVVDTNVPNPALQQMPQTMPQKNGAKPAKTKKP